MYTINAHYGRVLVGIGVMLDVLALECRRHDGSPQKSRGGERSEPPEAVFGG